MVFNTKNNHITIIALGSLLEWTEVSFYGYMANLIGKLFFPNYDLNTGLLLTYGLFALGYFTRPIGSIFFGYIGDKFGRKPALILSMLMMSISTFGIGLLPTYASIGITAPILLLCLRISQSIALSGESSGPAIYLLENTPVHQRCFVGSIVSCATGLGLVFGAIISTIVKLPSMPEYAWRIPFILSGFSSILVFIMRAKLTETSEFLAAKNKRLESPLQEIFKTQKNSILYVATISAIIGAFYYVNNIFYLSFLRDTIKIAPHTADLYAMFGQILNVILIPIFGKMADNLDYLKLFKTNILLAVFGSPLMFYLGSLGNNYILMTELMYAINGALLCSSMMRIIFDRFTTTSRYTGTSFAWSIGAALVAGPSAAIAQYLNTTYNAVYAPGLYISVLALIAYVTLTIIDKQNA